MYAGFQIIYLGSAAVNALKRSSAGNLLPKWPLGSSGQNEGTREKTQRRSAWKTTLQKQTSEVSQLTSQSGRVGENPGNEVAYNATGTRGIALLTDSNYSLRQMRPPVSRNAWRTPKNVCVGGYSPSPANPTPPLPPPRESDSLFVTHRLC